MSSIKKRKYVSLKSSTFRATNQGAYFLDFLVKYLKFIVIIIIIIIIVGKIDAETELVIKKYTMNKK